MTINRKAFLHCASMFLLLAVVSPSFAIYCTFTEKPAWNPKSIRSIMEKVANWQLNEWKLNGNKYPKWDWTNAAGYKGLFELAKISKSKIWYKYLLSVGNELDWNTGSNRFYADDYCIGQTYANLYEKYKDEKMIAKFRLLAESIIAQPHTGSLEWKNNINHREWAWCDALFMGPPSLAYLATATGEMKYFDIMDKLWWKTYDYLYDKTEHLFFRDGSNFARKEKNEKKVFWSMGNGWVMAGLVRVLDNLPADYLGREKYVTLFNEMAEKLASIQQPDGSWHTSLLDPASYPFKETSGTGFNTYALVWDINNKILEKAKYGSVTEKAWNSLITAIQPNGRLGYVQLIGWKPEPASPNSTEIFCVSAFLITGSEMFKYSKIIR